MREIFEQGRIPKRIRTDKGQEFRAKEVPDVLNNFGVIHLHAQNETKAAVAERAIKTIKTRIYLTYQQSYRYTDKLQTFVKSQRIRTSLKRRRLLENLSDSKLVIKSDLHMLEIHFPVNMMKGGRVKYLVFLKGFYVVVYQSTEYRI